MVKPYYEQIIKARNPDGDKTGAPQSRSQKRLINALKRNKKKLKTLENKISAAKAGLQEASEKKKVTFEDDLLEDKNNAGNLFGGKSSKRD